MSEVKLHKTTAETYIKQHLIQQIDNLKSDIQTLLDNKKSLKDKDEITKIMGLKQKKMDQLKILNNKLKDVIKKERYEIQKQNEIFMVSKAIDTLEFTGAKRKNNYQAMDKAKQEKQQRDQIKMQFLEYKELEKTYLEQDCEKLPAFLFLSRDILKTYGLCPYLDVNLEENSEVKYNNRLEWLKSTDDNGKKYFDCFDDLIEKKSLEQLELQKNNIENEILNFVEKVFTELQLEYFKNSIDFLNEYVNCHIKTKRIKERFKLMINNLSILYSETNLEIHNYLSIRFGIPIIVNIMENKNVYHTQLDISIMTETFLKYLEEYHKTIENMENKRKYITNTLKNLKMDLYYYLTDKQAFIKKENIIQVNRSNVLQEGKYFKKWSCLTKDEKLERLKSFSVYYIDKMLVETKLIDASEREKKVDILNKILYDAFKSKHLSYKHISWNVKRGIIQYIKVLTVSTEENNCNFILDIINENGSKDTELDKDDTKKDDTNKDDTNKDVKETSVNEGEMSVKVKKKISSKTIINKDSEQIINEQLLYFILKRVQNGIKEVKDDDKDNFLEKLKQKLKVKKVSNNDKKRIFEKYNEIFTVVKNNA